MATQIEHGNSHQTSDTNDTVQQAKDVLTGHDEPMAEKKPGLSAALVFLTYPAMIIGVVLIAFAIISMF